MRAQRSEHCVRRRLPEVRTVGGVWSALTPVLGDVGGFCILRSHRLPLPLGSHHAVMAHEQPRDGHGSVHAHMWIDVFMWGAGPGAARWSKCRGQAAGERGGKGGSGFQRRI